jgi:hypothetical protein
LLQTLLRLPPFPQVIAASRCVTINTCHDCILYLAANQPPLLLGDNRFLQLAPYNSGYERLPAHMSLAGVQEAPNHWDQPLALLPDHSKHHHPPLHGAPGAGGSGGGADAPSSPMQQWQQAAQQREQGAQLGPAGQQQQPLSPAQMPQPMEPMDLSQQHQQQQLGGAAGSAPDSPPPGAGGHLGEEGLPTSPMLGAPAAVTVLPPSKLMPFVVPFRGGAGPMCGGPAAVHLGIRPSSSTAATASASDSLSNFMSVGEGAAGNFPASPFALPPAYAEAWQQKMRGAAEVRAAVKAVSKGLLGLHNCLSCQLAS